MSVTQIKQSVGGWNVRLRGNIPKAVLSTLQPFGHIAIVPGSVNVAEYGDALLNAARYVGVYRTKSANNDGTVISGVGLESWLGDENNSGDVFEFPQEFDADTFAVVIGAVLPPSGSITAGTIHSLPGLYTGRHQYVTSRQIIDYVTSTYGAEWRINNNGTLDAGLVTDLYATTPRAILVAKQTDGSDLRYRSMPGQSSMIKDSADYTTRVVVLSAGEGDTITVGESAPVPVPYKDLHGNDVVVTRVVSESFTDGTNADTRAEILFNEWGQASTPRVTLSTSIYDIKGNVVVGDYVYVYHPERGFEDVANQETWNGEIINPVKLRVVELSWPIRTGWTVAFRDGDGVWTDLSPYVFYESGDTNVVVGDLPRSLTGGGIVEPVGSRPIGDATIPGAVTFTSSSTGSYQSAETNTTKSAIRLTWGIPLNADGSTILDGAYYELRYRVSVQIGYQIKWADTNGMEWADIQGHPWAFPLSEPVEASPEWHYLSVGWGTNVATILELTPAVEYEIQIRAVDAATPPHFGVFSGISVTTVGDLFAPSVPAPPVVAGSMTAIMLTHTLGKNSGGTFNLEPDIVRLTVHVGGSADFYPDASNQVGELAANAGMLLGGIAAVGTFPITPVEQIHVKVIAVDRAGNSSNPSPSATVTVQLIDNAHIGSLSVDKLTAGTITAESILAARMGVSGAGGLTVSGGGDITVLGGGDITIQEGSLDILNNLGEVQVESGLLSDGTYGLAARNASGVLVPLSRLAFGVKSEQINNSESTTNTSNFVDLATYGPYVTDVEVGPLGRMIIILSCGINIGGSSTVWGAGGYMGFDMINQATGTVFWTSSQSVSCHYWALGLPALYQGSASISRCFLMTNIPAGIYTLVTKYLSFGVSSPGTTHAEFFRRNITVLPY
jgi:hypothetical protein